MVIMNANPLLDFFQAQLHIRGLEAEAALERELRLARAERAQPPVVQFPAPRPKVTPTRQLLKG
jgi:hypothetical protein